MNRTVVIPIAILAIVVILCAGLLINQNDLAKKAGDPEAYVGVTYGGNTVEQGKLLIDRVKGYSNLFILASGLLQRDLNSVNQLGDYAVSSGMYFLPYFGNFIQSTMSSWLNNAKQRWGTHFLGVYYADEPGGKMLDDYVEYKDAMTGDSITKTKYGDVVVQKTDGVVINYELDGVIRLFQPPSANENSDIDSEADFYPNGTIITVKPAVDGFTFHNYQELIDIKPFKDINETAQRFCDRDKSNIELLSNYTRIFTSDYALYWFDYKAGYDAVLGHVGWNLSLTQQLALIRGAAHQQNKEWGIIITWKYQTSPYLDNKTEILSQMKIAYEAGAKYLVLFNYYDSENSTYGTMGDPHFQALESFWKNINNNQISHNSIQPDSVVVFPRNYGWGTRWPEDKVWGIFKGDQQTKQIWTLMQQALETHGLKTDIAFDDEKFPLSGYQNVYSCKEIEK